MKHFCCCDSCCQLCRRAPVARPPCCLSGWLPEGAPAPTRTVAVRVPQRWVATCSHQCGAGMHGCASVLNAETALDIAQICARTAVNGHGGTKRVGWWTNNNQHQHPTSGQVRSGSATTAACALVCMWPKLWGKACQWVCGWRAVVETYTDSKQRRRCVPCSKSWRS